MQDRVLADNPLEDETELPLGEILPAEWRVVRLEHTEPNGTRHIIERGVPLDEINGNAGLLVVEDLDRVAGELDVSSESVAERTLEPIRVGQTIFIDLPEHGISADFLVKEIRSCPTLTSGDGYLVTTKFIHENAEILDLRIAGSDEPIGTTASHPFWSEDRQQFVAAGDLRVGENLLLANDTTRRVDSLTRRENRETVYNIEVDGEHVFYVGEDGVLVHNSCTHHMHHSIPRGIQRRLARAGNSIAGHADIIGRAGLPNRIRVGVGKHLQLHSGKGYIGNGGIGGGHYNNLFHQKILQRGGYGAVTVQDILQIRDSLVRKFRL